MVVYLYIISDLALKKAVRVDVSYHNNYYFATNKDLEIFIGDSTLKGALSHFSNFLVDDYKNFVRPLSKTSSYYGKLDLLLRNYKIYIDN